MTIYELHSTTDRRRAAFDVAGAFQIILARIARHQRRRQTMRSLAHLDDFQLRDIGLDPDDVAAARNGDGQTLWQKIRRLR